MMWLSSILNSRTLSSPHTRPRRRPSPSQAPAAIRLPVEALEARRLPSFPAPVTSPVGVVPNAPSAVMTADFNGDGRLDLAVTNYYSNTVSVLLGNSDGTFQPALTSATGANPFSLAVGDFNADGKLDLVTANAYGLSVLL